MFKNTNCIYIPSTQTFTSHIKNVSNTVVHISEVYVYFLPDVYRVARIVSTNLSCQPCQNARAEARYTYIRG
jgi:hypothetical protein